MLSKDAQALAKCYLFQDLTEHEKQEALKLLHVSCAEYPAGSVIFSRDSFSPALVYVISGTLTVHREHNRKAVLMKQMKAGESFGPASMFGECLAYPTTVKAKTAARIAAIDQPSLEELFLKFPKTALSHIRFLSEKIRFLNERLDATTGRNVESKVSKYIVDNIGKETYQFNLNMTDIAKSLDIGRASLYRLLTRLEGEGLIEVRHGHVTVLQLESLKRKANI